MSVWIATMAKEGDAGAVKFMGYDMIVTESYAGCVVETGEHNGYDDSDFFAIVWDAEKGDFREVTYGTTRAWTYGNSAKVDAPAELIEKYRAKCRAEADARAIERAKRNVRPGATVVVVKGRKVPKGAKGRVGWFGPDRFRRNAYRAGVVLEGSTNMVFVDAANLEVVLDA